MNTAEPSLYSLVILRALNLKRLDNVYMGTVPKSVKVSRRAAGKVAKASRKANRGR